MYYRLAGNCLKLLLDAYQCAYKKNTYYWTDLHLVIRVMFWGLSFLNKNISLMINIVLLLLIIWLLEKLTPYARNVNNFMEMLFLLNIYSVHAIVSTCKQSIF